MSNCNSDTQYLKLGLNGRHIEISIKLL